MEYTSVCPVCKLEGQYDMGRNATLYSTCSNCNTWYEANTVIPIFNAKEKSKMKEINS